jgi:site-specific DNA recombinase
MTARNTHVRDAASGILRRKRAVLYLPVSTSDQVNTDYNPEGISIPAQREAGTLKAAQLEADIVAEFIEPGRSATNVDKRPKFQEMYAWVKAQGDIDYIIVYHFNRIFRNSVDAAITKRDLGKFGTRVISTVLHLDDSPESKMIETIMHAVDQYQSEASGADIAYKMGQKVKNGGSVGLAKLGYLNIRDHIDGREIRTVAIDPERAPLIRQAFELFANGDYAGPQLQIVMAEAGLRTRGTKRVPAQPLSLSRLYEMLGDRYYLGIVTLKGGEEFPGRHEPLVDEALFERVQRVLALRGGGGTRQRKYDHHLKGGLWCARSGHRIVIAPGKGNGGTYFYFLCRGRMQKRCDLPYLSVADVTRAVEQHYATVRLSDAFQAQVRRELDDVLKQELSSLSLARRSLTDRLHELELREDRLLDLIGDPEWPQAKIKQKLAQITADRTEIGRQLQEARTRLDTGRQFFMLALDLLQDPQACYLRAGGDLRRAMNKLIFTKLYVDDLGVARDELAPGFHEIIDAHRRPTDPDGPAPAPTGPWTPEHATGPVRGADGAGAVVLDPFDPTGPSSGRGSNRTNQVEVAGIEPAWTAPFGTRTRADRDRTRQCDGVQGHDVLTPSTGLYPALAWGARSLQDRGGAVR